jgi:sirohydrochlorin cobaltochelatase
MVNEGVGRISVVPLFLGVGKHAREDLPQLLSDIQAQHPQLDLTCQRPVGENQAVIELLAQLALGRPMPY